MPSEAPDRVYHDHNVYILGAGFSRDAAGLPTISEFMRAMTEAAEWLASRGGRQGEIDAIRNVLKFRREAASAAYRVNLRLENIEELFSLASISEGDVLTDHVITAISATIDYAHHEATPSTLQISARNALWEPPAAWEEYPGVIPKGYKCPRSQFYVALLTGAAGLNQQTDERRDTVITFNYDLTIERALRALNLGCTYGLTEQEAEFETEVCRPEPDSAAALRILKLHGSTNWARPEEANGKLLVRDSYEAVRKLKRIPMLVPPTWRKSFGHFLLPIWNAAIEELSTATRVIIAGYSVPETDLHFKYLVAAGLQKNISLRSILFVNRDAEALKARVAGILRKDLTEWNVVEYENKTLREFFLDGLVKINRYISPVPPLELFVELGGESSLPRLSPRMS